jgi:hypothetical protein
MSGSVLGLDEEGIAVVVSGGGGGGDGVAASVVADDVVATDDDVGGTGVGGGACPLESHALDRANSMTPVSKFWL